MNKNLTGAVDELLELLPKLKSFEPAMRKIGDAMMNCWNARGKVLIAGNGGSAADAMHFAEELVVRFKKDRRALAAIALTDATVITCGGNDYGYDTIFARQVEALGNPGDVFIALSTSGNSENINRAIALAKEQKMVTVAFLGKGGGKARGLADIEMIIPSTSTGRVQEAHKVLFHTLCDWVDSQVD